jgi:hypothetical protein
VGKLQPILSQVPQEFEASIFRTKAERERGRYEAKHHLETLLDSADEAPFDIDEVSEADLKLPEMPPSPLTPEYLDRVLGDPRLLPPGVECEPLEPGTYALQIPGMEEKARVTANPAVFDEHFESHQMVCPDSPIFRWLLRLVQGG